MSKEKSVKVNVNGRRTKTGPQGRKVSVSPRRHNPAVEKLVEDVDNSPAAIAIRAAFAKLGMDVGAVKGIILCFEQPSQADPRATVAYTYHYGRTPEFMEEAIALQKFAPGDTEPGFYTEHREQLERNWVQANG